VRPPSGMDDATFDSRRIVSAFRFMRWPDEMK
jgi:hypothetical protein